jgi:hypothetical protein
MPKFDCRLNGCLQRLVGTHRICLALTASWLTNPCLPTNPHLNVFIASARAPHTASHAISPSQHWQLTHRFLIFPTLATHASLLGRCRLLPPVLFKGTRHQLNGARGLCVRNRETIWWECVMELGMGLGMGVRTAQVEGLQWKGWTRRQGCCCTGRQGAASRCWRLQHCPTANST